MAPKQTQDRRKNQTNVFKTILDPLRGDFIAMADDSGDILEAKIRLNEPRPKVVDPKTKRLPKFWILEVLGT